VNILKEIPPKPKRTLFEIGADAAALDALLEELEGDLSDPEVCAAIDDWLHETQGNLETKLDGYAALIRKCEARASARKEEARRLAELAKTDENKAARLKERLKYFFEAQGLQKVETSRYKISLAVNGGKVPLLVDDNADWEKIGSMSPDFVVTRVEPNKEALREALEDVETVPGAVLGVRGTSLRIK